MGRTGYQGKALEIIPVAVIQCPIHRYENRLLRLTKQIPAENKKEWPIACKTRDNPKPYRTQVAMPSFPQYQPARVEHGKGTYFLTITFNQGS